MSPSADKAQCCFCLGYRRIKQDGTFYAHDRGGRVKTRCPGSGRTREEALRAKSEGVTTVLAQAEYAPKQVEPEDIF